MPRKLSAEKAAIKIVSSINAGQFSSPAEVVEAHEHLRAGLEMAKTMIDGEKIAPEGKVGEKPAKPRPRPTGSGSVVRRRI